MNKVLTKTFCAVAVATLLSSCSNKITNSISKQFIHAGPGYSKAVVIVSNNIKTIYVAGLTGEGENLEAQTRATYNNIKTELEACGATLKDIVKTTTYIVNYRQDDIAIFRKVRKEVMGEKDMPSSTVIGVQALAEPSKIIEIEVVAVVEMKK